MELSKEELVKFVKKQNKKLKAREEEVAQAQARVAQLEAEVAQRGQGGAEEDAQGQGEDVAKLRAAVEAKDAVIADKEQQHKAVLVRLKEIIGPFKSLQKKHAALKQQAAAAEEERCKLQGELQASRNKAEEGQLKISSLQEMLDEALSPREKPSDLARAEELGHRVAELEQQLKDSQSVSEEAQASLKAAEDARQQEQSDAEELRQQVAELQQTLENENRQLQQKQEEENRAQADELRQRVATLQQQLEDAKVATEEAQRREQTQAEEARQQLAELKQALEDNEQRESGEQEGAQACVEQLEQKIADLQSQLRESNGANQAATASLAEAVEARKREQAQAEELQLQVAELQQALEDSNTQANHEEEELVPALRKRVADLEQQLDSNGSHPGGEENALREQVAELEQQLEESREANDKAQTQAQVAQEEVFQLQQQLESASPAQVPTQPESDAQVLQVENENLQARVADLEVHSLEMNRLATENQDLTARVAELEGAAAAIAAAEATALVAIDASVHAAMETQVEHQIATDATARLESELADKTQAAQDWQKKATEFAKRFKLAKAKLAKVGQASKASEQKQAASVLYLGLLHAHHATRASLVQRAFSCWREKVSMQLRSQLEARAEEVQHTVEAQQRELKESLEQRVEAFHKESVEQKRQIEAHETRVEELEELVSQLRSQLQEQEALATQRIGAPPGFDPTRHVRCVVEVDDTLWVGVDGSLRDASAASGVEWVSAQTIGAWVGEDPGKHRFELPKPVQEQVRRQEAAKVQEAKEEAAWAMSQAEALKSDLANYKRRAQIALKKAQDEARRFGARAEASEQQQRQQLESELARVTRLMDTKQEEIETVQAGRSAVEAELAQARRELENAVSQHSKMEQSISDRIEDMRATMTASHKANLEQLQADHDREVQALRADADARNTKLEKAETALEEQVAVADAAEVEKDKLEAHMHRLEIELADAQAKLKEAEAKAAEAAAAKQLSSASLSANASHHNQQPPLPHRNSTLGRRGSSQHERKTGLRAPKRRDSLMGKPDPEHTGLEKLEIGLGGRPKSLSVEALSPDGSDDADGDQLQDEDLDDASPKPYADSTLSAGSNHLFVEQLDSLHHQHARERIVWQRKMENLREQIEEMEMETRLLHEQNKVLKEEIRDHERTRLRQEALGDGPAAASAGDSVGSTNQRKEENLTYLKNVLYKYMAAKEASERQTLLPVVGTILQFSPAELSAIKTALDRESGSVGAGGVVDFLFGAS
ncbi:GRIP and coiled-coil domain-containing protein 2 (185 kDa Golgi coiled-coil protein) (GCC185) [Durusdinium trenchii]|uniref:GRIP and coiled-coil domain-containing protein 2 (185 kDa Golgi coiled-coil protein) (GCC185) n=1 Tax=Durusdinium trenchii TaxID=1381693 RepID=A0ABP0SP27_9DINO